MRFFFLPFAHTSLADATEWKSTVMGSANACARDLVIDSPARLLGHYIARSRGHGKIRVYDNPAAWRLRLVRASPLPPSSTGLYVKQITGNPVVAVAVADDAAAAAAAVVADRWMPHRQRRRKQRARSKCTL